MRTKFISNYQLRNLPVDSPLSSSSSDYFRLTVPISTLTIVGPLRSHSTGKFSACDIGKQFLNPSEARKCG